MELRELEAFAHVAVHASFTRAAEILNTSQPALSRLVRHLEVELHQTLLLRNGRGTVPTLAGEVLLVHCSEIMLHVQRAKDSMQTLQGSARQKLALGLVPHIAKFATLTLVRDMRAHFPGAAVTVVEGASNVLLESLLMDRIDAAIMYETPRSGLIEKRTLLREELYFIGPGSAGTTPLKSMRFKEVSQFPLVISSRMHAIREVVEAQAAKHQVKLIIALEVDAITSALDLVQEGYGYALLPLNALERDDRKRELSITRITDPVLNCRLVIATSRQRASSTFVRNALDLLEKRVVPKYVEYEKARNFRSNPMVLSVYSANML